LQIMADYELTLEIRRPTDVQIAALYDAEDALVSSHGQTSLVTMTAEGSSALAAARRAVASLEQHGIEACRLYEDLVTRSEIARRCEVTSQAVGLWTRGERQSGASRPFPEPNNYACGSTELWLWHDVNDWLTQLGKSDGMAHPSRVDYVLVNDWLLQRTAGLPPRLTGFLEAVVSMSCASVGVQPSALSPAAWGPEGSQREFSLRAP